MGRRAAFALPGRRRLASLLSVLRRAGYGPGGVAPVEAEDRYFDTQNGAFYRAGERLSLRTTLGAATWRLEREDGTLLQAADESGWPETGPLREALTGRACGRRLLVQSRVRVAGRLFPLEGPGPSLSEVLLARESFALDDGPFGGGRRALEVILRSGEEAELERLSAVLRSGAGCAELSGDGLEAALAHFGLPLPGAPIPPALRVCPADLVALAARKVLGQQAYRMRANAAGTVADKDPEFLHDLRVATRRARSALRLFAPALGARRCESLRGELGWIAALLGDVRDLDIFLGHLPSRLERARATEATRAWLEARLGRRRREALAALAAALGSRRYGDLLGRIERLAGSPAPARPRGLGAQTAAHAAPALIRAAARKARRWGSTAPELPDPAHLHRLRILFKRLRYACEFFREALEEETGRYLALLVDLQDCLGAHQDAVAASAALRELAGEAASSGAPPSVLLDLGALLQVLRGEGEQRRSEFGPLWKMFRKQAVPAR